MVQEPRRRAINSGWRGRAHLFIHSINNSWESPMRFSVLSHEDAKVIDLDKTPWYLRACILLMGDWWLKKKHPQKKDILGNVIEVEGESGVKSKILRNAADCCCVLPLQHSYNKVLPLRLPACSALPWNMTHIKWRAFLSFVPSCIPCA